MPIPESKLREILQEYEIRLQREKDAKDGRVNEVYAKLPQVKAIDSEIESFSLNAMRAYLQNGHDPALALSQLRSRMDELFQQKKALLRSAGFPEDYMEMHYTCPICNDTGYVDHQRCRCLQQKLIDAAYDQSGLRRILARENRSTFDLSLFSAQPFGAELVSPRQNITKILRGLTTAIQNFAPQNGQNFLFTGTTGTGQTFMANCIAKEILDRGYTVLYVTAYDLCARLESERFRDRARTPQASFSLDFIYSCDFLIIDDLGTEFSNSLSVTELFHCINQRILDQRSTLISTNLTFKELAAAYGDRFSSRLAGNFTLYRFYGPDLRLEARRRKQGEV